MAVGESPKPKAARNDEGSMEITPAVAGQVEDAPPVLPEESVPGGLSLRDNAAAVGRMGFYLEF